MRIPGGDQMMMVHGQAARHEDTWRRSDDDGTQAVRHDDTWRRSDDDGTRAGSRIRGYLEEIR